MFFIVTLPVTILSTLLYWLVVADAFLGRWRRCLTGTEGCALCLAVCGSVAILLLSISISLEMDIDLKQSLSTSLKSLMSSCVMWFPVWTILPFVGFLPVWCIERKAHEDEDDDEDSEYKSDSDIPETPTWQLNSGT